MSTKKSSPLFKVVKAAVTLVYPRLETVGIENLTDGPVIIVGNHCQMNGPLAGELYFPGKRYIWCAGEMMHLKDVPDYAFQDFWSRKPKWNRWLFRIASYLIAPLSVFIFNNAHTIPVYKDVRLITTFRTTMERLQEGNNIIIFPEYDEEYNNILYKFHDKFIDLAKLYYKKTGVELTFVPLYIAPKLRKMYLGKGIRFRADEPIAKERRHICDYLMNEITAMARALPEHTVVPYRNMSAKYYPSNKVKEAANNEKVGC